VVYNWQLEDSVVADISGVSGLRNGDRYELRNAFDYYGTKVVENAVYDGSGQLVIEMQELPHVLPFGTGYYSDLIKAPVGPEFGAFVLIKKP
jgi:hypothetical protein